jgi:stage V sporulation protein G
VEITEVRIKLMDEPGERLKAFCSVTFDDAFVVRDLKIIEGASGPFVAMPSRKLTAHCPGCRAKNHLRAAYCNQCGTRLKEASPLRDEEGRAKLYADIAHPINSACRELIQRRVIEAFEAEMSEARLPGYVPSYDDFHEEETVAEVRDERHPAVAPAQVQPAEKPRGPHRLPAHPSHAAQPTQSAERPKNDFGAGVFD